MFANPMSRPTQWLRLAQQKNEILGKKPHRRVVEKLLDVGLMDGPLEGRQTCDWESWAWG